MKRRGLEKSAPMYKFFKGEHISLLKFVGVKWHLQHIYADASFIKFGLEIRKLQWFEYVQNDRHGCRHIWGFVTSLSPN